VLYERGPKRIPPGMALVSEELILRLEQLIGAGDSEQAVMRERAYYRANAAPPIRRRQRCSRPR